MEVAFLFLLSSVNFIIYDFWFRHFSIHDWGKGVPSSLVWADMKIFLWEVEVEVTIKRLIGCIFIICTELIILIWGEELQLVERCLLWQLRGRIGCLTILLDRCLFLITFDLWISELAYVLENWKTIWRLSSKRHATIRWFLTFRKILCIGLREKCQLGNIVISSQIFKYSVIMFEQASWAIGAVKGFIEGVAVFWLVLCINRKHLAY